MNPTTTRAKDYPGIHRSDSPKLLFYYSVCENFDGLQCVCAFLTGYVDGMGKFLVMGGAVLQKNSFFS